MANLCPDPISEISQVREKGRHGLRRGPEPRVVLRYPPADPRSWRAATGPRSTTKHSVVDRPLGRSAHRNDVSSTKNARSTGDHALLAALAGHLDCRIPTSTSTSCSDRTSEARRPPSRINNTTARSRCVSRSARNTAKSSASRLFAPVHRRGSCAPTRIQRDDLAALRTDRLRLPLQPVEEVHRAGGQQVNTCLFEETCQIQKIEGHTREGFQARTASLRDEPTTDSRTQQTSTRLPADAPTPRPV